MKKIGYLGGTRIGTIYSLVTTVESERFLVELPDGDFWRVYSDVVGEEIIKAQIPIPSRQLVTWREE